MSSLRRWASAVLPDQQQLRRVVTCLYYSRLTAALYLATFLLAGVLLAMTLGLNTPLRDAPRTMLLMELLVSLSLVLEVGLRAAVLRRAYLQTWTNLLDLIVAAS